MMLTRRGMVSAPKRDRIGVVGHELEGAAHAALVGDGEVGDDLGGLAYQVAVTVRQQDVRVWCGLDELEVFGVQVDLAAVQPAETYHGAYPLCLHLQATVTDSRVTLGKTPKRARKRTED